MADMTWVENTHYNRVRAQARDATRRKQESDRRLRTEKERMDRELREAEQAATADARLLERRVQEETDRLLEGIDQVSYELRAAVAQHVAQTRQEMDGLRSAVRAVEQQAVQMDGKIDQLESNMAQRFREMADAIAAERTRAQLYRNQFAVLVEQVSALHSRELLPGVLENQLTPTTDFLDADMENGDYQAAIGLAQTKIPDAVEILQQLQQLNERFRQLSLEGQRLLEELGQQLAQLDEKEHNRYDLTMGEIEYEYNGDIQYWTNGLYSVAVENFDDVRQQYTQARDAMNLEVMERALRHLEQVALQLEECRQVAQEEFRISAMVQNMVTEIHDALTRDAAWTLTESGFAGDDERRPYRLRYSDGAGCTATVVVLPNREVSQAGQPGDVQFVVGVHQEGSNPDPFRCQVLRNGLLARLKQEHIPLGPHNIDPKYGIDRDRASFEQEATRQGDDVKEDRLAMVRRQLELAD